MIKILSDSDLSQLLPYFEENKNRYLYENHYNTDILDGIAGDYLRYYILATHETEKVKADFHVTDADVLYTRYYWLSKVSKKLTSVLGRDSGVSQQLFMLIEEIDQKMNNVDWPLIENIDNGTYS
jgi:hypothetical protein